MVISYSFFFFFLFLFKFARRSLAISLIEGTGVGVIRFSMLKINVIVTSQSSCLRYREINFNPSTLKTYKSLDTKF